VRKLVSEGRLLLLLRMRLQLDALRKSQGGQQDIQAAQKFSAALFFAPSRPAVSAAAAAALEADACMKCGPTAAAAAAAGEPCAGPDVEHRHPFAACCCSFDSAAGATSCAAATNLPLLVLLLLQLKLPQLWN
jgi:hypothetical protein